MRTRSLLMLTTLLALVVSECGGPVDAPASGVQPTADVLSALSKDDAIAALLPGDVRAASIVKSDQRPMWTM
ncbi:hypothetical protein [Saccharothrix deserti]|uniref:hypothetical protein n=1 Tax=Saccharothrix deserti TaxID=2593674 RepID=UPI00131C8D4E|nr:hypothetical protein [Saccharothrix deserti]